MSGQVEVKRCPKCGGSGKIKESYGGFMYFVECPVCRGKGYIE